MIRQIFYKENRGKVLLGVLAIVALLGLLLPNRTQKTQAELQAGLDTIRQEMVVLQQDVEASNTSQLASLSTQLASLSTRIDQINSTINSNINSLSAKVDSNKNDYTQRLTALQNMWSTIVGNNADYSGSISDLEARVSAIEAYLNVIHQTESLLIAYNSSTGFNTSCGWCPVIGNGWVGQQVAVGSRPIELHGVKMYLKRAVGLPTTVTLRIFAVGVTGLPSGSPVYSRTYDASKWSESPTWQPLDVSNFTLLAGRIYCFILEDVDGTTNSSISVGFNYGGTYSGGAWVVSTDGGTSWRTTPTADAGFEIWGILK